MCRFIAYLGNPLIVDDILFKPKYSLVKQSVHSREKKEPLNGDGFGLGWYAQNIDFQPALFRSIQPAWNDLNLRYLAAKLRSTCFFAHIRSASKGGVSLYNCHPFHFKEFLFMHNGDIGDFDKIKRYMRRQLSNDIYNWIQGQTDSEHFFALFLEKFQTQCKHFEPAAVAKVIVQTLQEVEKLKMENKVTEPSVVNAVITNGKCMTAVRYVSDPKATAQTLYYAVGSQYEYRNGSCRIRSSKKEKTGAVLIVSERLTSYNIEWLTIPLNHMLLVYDDLSTTVIPI